MSKRGVLVLTPADNDPSISGSVLIDADCGHRAWISPSGMTGLLGMPLRTVCLDCLPAGPLTVAELPGARQELAAHLGAAAAEQVIADVHRRAAAGHPFDAQSRRARRSAQRSR